MPLFWVLPFAAAALSLLLAVASLVRKKPSRATWCFAAGMTVLGLDSLCTGLSLRAISLSDVLAWLTRGLLTKSLLPAAWLGFSLTYSRGDWQETLARWRAPLALLAIVPIVIALGFRHQLFALVPSEDGSGGPLLRSGTAAVALQVTLLVAFVLALMNLEQTFRAAVGTMRWRIKYVVLGLAVIFGAQIYVRSEAILFSAHDASLAGIESSALLIGCALLAVAYARTGLTEIDVYPSRAVLRSSLTVLIVGGYLFIVGVLAQSARRFGGAESFQVQAFVVLLGVAGLAVLLLSDRLRQRVHGFVGRHFSKAQHDSARIWTDVSRQFSRVQEEPALCSVCARLVASTFEVLSVSIWLVDDAGERLVRRAATAVDTGADNGDAAVQASTIVAGLRRVSGAIDLDANDEAWLRTLRRVNPTSFPNGGHRWCVPLRTGERLVGLIVLADRVNGVSYSPEELELLQCIADQMTSVLVNLRLGDEVARARELEAFRTMSAFFVHDLKNAAASLNLMLKNLPVHFDDPAFRADALRGIGNTARRIDEMIARLGAIRQAPRLSRAPADLNELVTDAIAGLGGTADVVLARALPPLPPVLVDREQMSSVVTNLLLNARDAVGPAGRIEVRTAGRDGRVTLSVADDGCGMTQAFLKDGLFRPFQSTKTKGLGIGMFQSRMVIEAHGGTIHVDSEVGKGTTVRVSLPVEDER